MLKITEIVTINSISFITFFICSLLLCLLILVSSSVLGGRSYSRTKNIPFESGINALGTAKLRLSIKFYLIAMLFVIFDTESLYIYAWSVVIRETGWIGFIEASIFILFFLISLYYLVRIGILNWTKNNFQ